MDDLRRRVLFVALATALLSGGELRAVEVLGTGTQFLLGNDLTDLDNDGVETSYLPPDNLGGFDATFFSSDEPGFGGGEFAFNVFDNVLGPVNDKWCCGTVPPEIVGADFRETYGTAFRLTHFTVASANDVPERDPRVWRIEGSNDGDSWTAIFSQDDPNASLWTARLQVLLFQEDLDYEVQSAAYSMFRMVTEATGLTVFPFFQLGEIEFFGEEGKSGEICDNGIDDDGDELIDCADPSCAPNAACQKRFVRGDCNGDGKVTGQVTDAVFLLNYNFLGGEAPPCSAACDINQDGAWTGQVTDAVYILNYNFMGGPAPPAPFPGCGLSTLETDNALGCATPTPAGDCP